MFLKPFNSEGTKAYTIYIYTLDLKKEGSGFPRND